ncbi:Alpha/Beta hydrolase protein [Pelagophyceae sp. CCMP2097]|nr:Alpha/Beta hydrolase protein [Pelagophyceae sp. CCMP2097]
MVGRELSKHGLGFFGVEYPGYGYSDGAPMQASFSAASEQAVAYLVGELGVDAARIVLVGQSVGAGAAMQLALRWPALYGAAPRVVLVSPFASLADMAAGLLPWVPRALFALLVKDPFDNAAAAAQLAPSAKLLVFHGARDDIVPFDQGRRVAAAFNGSTFVPLPGAGHNDVFNSRDVYRAIAAFAAAE